MGFGRETPPPRKFGMEQDENHPAPFRIFLLSFSSAKGVAYNKAYLPS